MELENITLDYLRKEYEKASTNATFRLWAHTYIQRQFNVDSATSCFVMNALFEHIGKYYTYHSCGNRIIFKVTGFELAGERFDSDSYIGNKVVIFPNCTGFDSEWACDRKIFEDRAKSGKYEEFEL